MGWPWRVVRRKLSNALGLSNGDTRTISIAPGQDPLNELDTVLHELMHSVLRAQGRQYDEEPEERYVWALAHGLTICLKDNPDLLAYINASVARINR